MAYLVLDSSVIVAALVETEEKHLQCKRLLEMVKDGHFVMIEPYSVFIEVVAAIRRRTGSEDLAKRIGEDLQCISNVYFLELFSSRAEKAAEIAKVSGLRGMDSIVVQIAEEFDAILVTLDGDVIKKSSKIVKVKNIDEF